MSAELSVLLVLLATTVLAALALRRLQGEPSPWWGAAWIALISGGIYGELGPGSGSTIQAELLLTSMFPFFTLAGALAHSGRPVPPQLFLALGGYVALRFLAMLLGPPEFALLLGLAVEPCVLLAAAYAVRRSLAPSGQLTQTLLPAALALVLIPRIVDTIGDLRAAPGEPILLWLAFGWPLGLLQLLSRIEAARRTSRAATQALEQNLRRFDAMAQSAFDLIAETNQSGSLVYASPSFRTVLGYEPSELVGISGFDLIHPEDLKLAARAALDFQPLDNMAHPPVRILHRDGSWRWIEGTARRYECEDGSSRTIMVSRDVTSRLRAEAAVRSSEDRLRALGEHSTDVITELDPDGRVVYVSSNVERTVGHATRDIVGLTLSQLAERIGAELPEDADEGLALLRAGVSLDHHLCRVRRGNGTQCWIETGAAAFPRPDGRTGYIAVSRDVTERRILAEKVRRADRLQSLALLAGGVAHDFNNLLTPILGNASLLRRQLPPDLSLHALTRDIEQSALRAGELTQQLLAYTGRSHTEMEPIQLGDLIEELIRLFEKTLPAGVALRRKLPRELPWVEGDRAQVRRVIMNLLSNALEAVGEGPGEIEVGAGTAVLGASDIERLEGGHDLRPGSYVLLEVSDPGHGIDEGTRSRIFDPFFTTKPMGQGLGLAALHGLARSHGAGIEVRTEPGQGTSFRVFFPRSEVQGRPRSAPKRPQAPVRGEGLVLVADNEDPVRRVAVRALRQSGFRTVEARDGHEAVEVFRRHAAEIVAVLLDVTMPNLRGDEAYLEMRKARADVPAVFSSGFSREKVGERLPHQERISFLQKPYLAEDLLERLQEVLGG